MPTLNSYQALLQHADLSTIYSKVKPLILDAQDIDKLQHTRHSDVRIFDSSINDFADKVLCTDNSIFFLVQPHEALTFVENGNIHEFAPYEMILVSNGDNANFKKWHFEKVDDISMFERNFESVDYSSYKVEKDSIDSLKKMKCDFLKTELEAAYKHEKIKLDEKSTISLKMPSFKI